jgi:portal protein
MATATLTPRALRQEDRDYLDPQSPEDLLWSARQRFKETLEATQDDRDQQAAAARFRAGAQWSPAARAARNTPGQARPCFTIPLQSVYIRQVVNAWRQAPQAMRVRPKAGPVSVQTAQVLEGMVRDIEQQSQAQIAYVTALDQAVGQGEGYFRLNLDYEDPFSFRQVIRIGAIPNRQCVFLDPAAQHPCGLDAEFGFVIETLSWSRFCFTYGVDPGELELWHVQKDVPWLTATTVQVAEYFYRVWEDDTLLRLQDGRVVRQSLAGDTFDGLVVAERATRVPCVYWAKLTGMHVLEQTRWLGQYIPLIRVPGDVSLIEGKVHHTGMVQPSTDAQSSYNYFVSAQTEAIAMAPKAPFRVTPQQVQGFEQYWNAANNANLPYLLWNPQVINGTTLVPPPERMVAEPPVQAISQARAMAAADIQSTLGMFSAAIGEPSNEKSGVAIQERRGESNQTTAHYAANMGWALETCGMQVLDLIKALYDTPQMVRTLAMDGEAKPVLVNRPFQGPDGQMQAHYLGQGAYEVYADSGPSYSSQREMAAERLGELGKVLPPEFLPLVADLWVGSLDIPYSQELAARLQTIVPPEALAATKDGNPQTQLATLQNQLQQLTQQMQAMQQQLQEAQQQSQLATQQLALTERANADLKVKLDDKSQENALKAQENQQEYALELRKLQLEEQKFVWQMQQVPPASAQAA